MNEVDFGDFEAEHVRLVMVRRGVGVRRLKLNVNCGRRPDFIPPGRRAAPRALVVYIMVRNMLMKELVVLQKGVRRAGPNNEAEAFAAYVQI
jgi:hypothetical protein